MKKLVFLLLLFITSLSFGQAIDTSRWIKNDGSFNYNNWKVRNNLIIPTKTDTSNKVSGLTQIVGTDLYFVATDRKWKTYISDTSGIHAQLVNQLAAIQANASSITGKQSQLNGNGFVKAAGTSISYDNSSYFPAAGGVLSGTAGNGYVGFTPQSAAPTVPSSGFKLFASSAGAFSWLTTQGYMRELRIRNQNQDFIGYLQNKPSYTLGDSADIAAKVDKATTIKINGVTKDLTGNQDWGTIGGGSGTQTYDLKDTSNGIIVYNVLKFGAKGDGVTDDRDAIQAAINKAVSDTVKSYGVIYFPYTGKPYIVGGRTITTAANGQPVNNAQLYIPDLTPVNTRTKPGGIKFLGQVAPSFYSVAAQTNNISPNISMGVVLQSTDSLDVTGCILGEASTSYPLFGSFNYVKTEIENLGFIVKSKKSGVDTAATRTGIDASNLAMFGMKNCFIQTETNHQNTGTPTPASTSYGVKMPHARNWGVSYLNEVWVYGFYTGILAAEHFQSSEYLYTSLCVNGIEFDGNMIHAATIQRLLAQQNKYHILVNSSNVGASVFNIGTLDMESDNTGNYWWSTTYDINQPSVNENNYGRLNFHRYNYSGYFDDVNFARSPNVSSRIVTDSLNKRYLSQGGDGWGATYTIGSKDAQTTQIQANNIPRVLIKSGGIIDMGGTPSTVTENGAVNVNGAIYSDAILSAPKAQIGIFGQIGTVAMQVKPATAIMPMWVSTSTGITTLQATTAGNVLVRSTTDNSFLTVGGSVSVGYTTLAGGGLAMSGSHYTVNCSGATASTPVLPTAVGIAGRIYVIKNSGTSTVTISTTSSQTIDGTTTYSLATQYKYVTVQSDGANWIIIGNN